MNLSLTIMVCSAWQKQEHQCSFNEPNYLAREKEKQFLLFVSAKKKQERVAQGWLRFGSLFHKLSRNSSSWKTPIFITYIQPHLGLHSPIWLTTTSPQSRRFNSYFVGEYLVTITKCVWMILSLPFLIN